MCICLFQARILLIHSLRCHCVQCKPNAEEQVRVSVLSPPPGLHNDHSEHVLHPQEDQRNDDECWVCKSEGEDRTVTSDDCPRSLGEDLLVQCDECPRSFHQKCHLPQIEDAVCKWAFVKAGDRSSEDTSWPTRLFMWMDWILTHVDLYSPEHSSRSHTCSMVSRLSECARLHCWYLTDFMYIVFVSRYKGQWLCTFCVFKVNQEWFHKNKRSREEAMSLNVSQHMLVRPLRRTLF